MICVDRWIQKHPEWFDSARIDIEDGHEGWRQLIDNALGSAEQLLSEFPCASFRIVQVKEKCGSLRIYFREESWPEEVSARLRDIMHAATDDSLSVCEICGAPAHLGIQGGCLSVRCPSCAPDGWVPISVEY